MSGPQTICRSGKIHLCELKAEISKYRVAPGAMRMEKTQHLQHLWVSDDQLLQTPQAQTYTKGSFFSVPAILNKPLVH